VKPRKTYNPDADPEDSARSKPTRLSFDGCAYFEASYAIANYPEECYARLLARDRDGVRARLHRHVGAHRVKVISIEKLHESN
jgi:hypothetical protein